MCGTWMPCTPMSRRRRMNAGAKPGVRTMGVMPTRSAAITMSCTSRRSKLVCSRSMNAASKPAWPMISTICGSAMPPTYVPSASPPSRRIFLTRFGCMTDLLDSGVLERGALALRQRRVEGEEHAGDEPVVPGDDHQLDEAGQAELAHDLVLERPRDRLEGEDVLPHVGRPRQALRQRGQISARPHPLDDVVAEALPARDLGVGDPLVGLAHRARRDQDRQLADVAGKRRAEGEKLAEVAH